MSKKKMTIGMAMHLLVGTGVAKRIEMMDFLTARYGEHPKGYTVVRLQGVFVKDECVLTIREAHQALAKSKKKKPEPEVKPKEAAVSPSSSSPISPPLPGSKLVEKKKYSKAKKKKSVSESYR